MRLPMTPAFRDERDRLDLRFCCEDCAYFDAAVDRCAHDWPEAQHRQAYYDDPNCPDIVFCKEFELK